jgi:hypothetical protein
MTEIQRAVAAVKKDGQTYTVVVEEIFPRRVEIRVEWKHAHGTDRYMWNDSFPTEQGARALANSWWKRLRELHHSK